MPPAVDRSPSSTSSPLSGRRIISRIASPFTSKSRNFTDFFIEVDEPHKQYSPGDVVHGSVRLRVLKPTRVTHVAVCLHGFVQVYKNPGSPGEGYRGNSGYLGAGANGGKRSGEYFGNGFASLFEDEIVLCGDGRLGEGSYQFNFELEFPDSNLPSSIDFERGTIAYMITASITRPITLSPTTTCDRKVYFVERIDISRMAPPKLRTITLEPISRRSRAKHNARKIVDPNERRSQRGGSTQRSERDNTSRASLTPTEGGNPGSPAPSEISGDSFFRSNGRTSQPDSSRHSTGASDTSSATVSKSNLVPKTITTTVESLSAGCLRGDNIGIRVTVNHTKPIKSLYGVIVTLYRQARVDMHPAIPLGPTEKGVTSKYEDYYPRSITGLGGLSLSGAGSSHVFRKDLAQVMVPLYVDPSSLTAEVTARVRVPEEAFPTINTVPGSMISFQYFVEAVVDIQGKLSTHDRSLASLGLNGAHPQLGGGSEGVDQAAVFAPYGSAVVDTAPIRRDKAVITCSFQVIVGTRDSERRKGKRKVEPVDEPERLQPHAQPPSQDHDQAQPGASERERERESDDGAYSRGGVEATEAYHHQEWPQQYHYAESYGQPLGSDSVGYQDWSNHYTTHAVPMPILPDESQLSEKERMQRAEARLLPSQPPEVESEHAGSASQEATAPYLPDEAGQHLDIQQASGHSAPIYSEASASHATAQRDAASPDYRPAESGPSYASPIDNKQELERQRLQAGASAPQVDEYEATGSSSTVNLHQPSAPTLAEADEHPLSGFDSHTDAAGLSGLPRYER